MEIFRANNAGLPGIYCYLQGRAVRIIIPEGFELCYFPRVSEELKSADI
jgi:hypothetical protein